MNFPDLKMLDQSFELNEVTGELFWKNRPECHFKNPKKRLAWNNRWAGKPALSSDNGRGYLAGVITVLGVKHRLQRHRVVYALYYRSFPKCHVDHIDGNTLNNSPKNLRSASNSQNMRNTKMWKNNTSGVKGVYWNSHASLWYAAIGINGKNKSLGYFKVKNEAVAVRKAAEEKFGFTNRTPEALGM